MKEQVLPSLHEAGWGKLEAPVGAFLEESLAEDAAEWTVKVKVERGQEDASKLPRGVDALNPSWILVSLKIEGLGLRRNRFRYGRWLMSGAQKLPGVAATRGVANADTYVCSDPSKNYHEVFVVAEDVFRTSSASGKTFSLNEDETPHSLFEALTGAKVDDAGWRVDLTELLDPENLGTRGEVETNAFVFNAMQERTLSNADGVVTERTYKAQRASKTQESGEEVQELEDVEDLDDPMNQEPPPAENANDADDAAPAEGDDATMEEAPAPGEDADAMTSGKAELTAAERALEQLQ